MRSFGATLYRCGVLAGLAGIAWAVLVLGNAVNSYTAMQLTRGAAPEETPAAVGRFQPVDLVMGNVIMLDTVSGTARVAQVERPPNGWPCPVLGNYTPVSRRLGNLACEYESTKTRRLHRDPEHLP